MITSSPVSRAKQPKWHESSGLQSIRESDATPRQWLRARKNGDNSDAIARQVGVLTQQMGRYRRRIVGGGGSANGTGLTFRGEYSGTSYPAQSMVIFTSDGGSSGTYVSIKSVPAGIAPDTGYPYWVALPFPPSGIFA